MIYGYVRISTKQQNIERQIRNIKNKYPDAVIIQEIFTGTKQDRPEWNKLYNKLGSGDVIIFDEVSRMSRNAEEGFLTYETLFNNNVELIHSSELLLVTYPHLRGFVPHSIYRAVVAADPDSCHHHLVSSGNDP